MMLFWRAMRKTGLLSRMNLRLTRRIADRPVMVPLHGGRGIELLAISELWMSKVLAVLFEHDQRAFVDVGVNMGQTTAQAVGVDPNRSVIAFEANPVCCSHLSTLFRINGWSQCQLIPVGLSGEEGIVTLTQLTDVDGAATLVPNFRLPNDATFQSNVAVMRGDLVWEKMNLPAPGVIKIDVEGAELDVVSGLRSVIAKHHPTIICEVLPVNVRDPELRKLRQNRLRDLLEILFGMGYEPYRIHPDATLQAHPDIGEQADLEMSNYLFIQQDYEGLVNRFRPFAG